MRLRAFLAVIVILTILLSGTLGLIRTGVYREKRELENTIENRDKIPSSTTFNSFSMIDSSSRFQRPKDFTFNKQESLPIIPYYDSVRLSLNDSLYTLNFSAEEGDKIHMKISVDSKPQVQIVLMPVDELSEYPDNRSFAKVDGIPEASADRTRHFEAHVTIPEDDQYTLVVRFLMEEDIWAGNTEFDIIIGRGLFSSIVVRTGGYIELFFVSSFFMIVLGTGFYIYKKRNKKSPIEEEGEWRKENIKKSERIENFGTKDPPPEDERGSSSDNREYLLYED